MKFLIFLTCMSVLIGCKKTDISIEKKDQVYKKFQILLLKEHNKQRQIKSKDILLIDKNLCEYAQKHADEMRKKRYIYHSNMDDLKKVLNSSLVGENVAWGQETEEDVVSSWMWSPLHRWNILDSNYKKVGFGMNKDDNNRAYWCVVFSD